MLADFGARVIKVEPPKTGDLMRGMGRGVREFKDAMENPAAGDEKNGKEQAAPQESRKETPEEKK